MSKGKHFVVVGAGMGGLATALRLAHRGYQVTVVEKNHEVGGRNRALKVGQSEFDSGPTLVMMLDPFRKLFADVGERLEDHLELSLCDPSYRAFFRDGTRIDGTPNIAKMLKQMNDLGLENDAAQYSRLIGDLGQLYHASVPNFVRRNYNSAVDLASPRALKLVTQHQMLANLKKKVDRYVRDERLRMLFSFQTMYLGLSPYDAPWVYGVLTYMEYGEGIWYPKGGVAKIAEKIADLATARGTKIRQGEPVCRADRNLVLLESGEQIHADGVILNADLPYAERAILRQPEPKKARRFSCSAFMAYIDYAGDLPTILHHNVFFGSDFKRNLDQIFHQRQLPDDPAFYVCVSSKTDPGRTAPGHSNVMILVPCANLGRPWTTADGEALLHRALDRLREEAGFDPDRIRAIKTYSPQDWNTDLNLDKGAAFGLSHDFWQSVCFRPSNKGKDGTYFVGASTAPGNGLPMVLISAELLERRLIDDGVISL
ncbi:MAG: phytoene desaturase [Armatimonadetes bacterium]|nr:phytoene desaturase [Armatimonadota bacterium]